MEPGSYPRSDRDLLRRIAGSAGGKAGYKQLVRELGLGGGRERRLLLEQLTQMVGRRELVRLDDGRWALPRSDTETQKQFVMATVGRASGRPGEALGSAQARPGSTHPSFSGGNGRERFASGRLDLHRDGFGFVRPEPGSGRAGVAGDIFIPPPELNGAMQGDLVLVEEALPGRDGRRSGRIARVLTRGNPTVVGIFHYAHSGRRGQGVGPGAPLGARGNYVVPLDERVGRFIEIPEGAAVPPDADESAHRVFGHEARRWRATGPTDPAAHGDRTDLVSAAPGTELEVEASARWPLQGLAVDVELTHFPAPGRPAIGRILDVLGRPDDFGVDVEMVIRKHHLPHTFPAAVLREADERSAASVDALAEREPEAVARREDFRGLPVVTIDGETARDFDDAVLVRELASGNMELQVHIADVSAFVQPGSALDTEARVRGTSVYFPDRAVPMLPAPLSSGVCSLRPDEDRLVLSCVMEIDDAGEILGYRLAEGIIRSVRRCTYTSVQSCLDASPSRDVWNAQKSPPVNESGKESGVGGARVASGVPRAHRPVTSEPSAEDFAERERVGLEQPEIPASFDRMLELALRLNAKRVRRGSIDFDLPEPIVEFDPDGNMKAIVRSERGWAHRLIEEFMLSANECVATWLTAQGAPSLYRIHEMPDPKRVVEFEEQAAGFGQSLGVGPLPVRRLTMKTDRREAQRRSGRGRSPGALQAHEVPGKIDVTPQMYQRLVRRLAGKPEERILAYLMLRSLKQARYAERNEGHFALASPCYTHFTSPIRRYPDLIVHRLVRAMLLKGADPHGGAVLSTDEQPWRSGAAVPEPREAARVLEIRERSGQSATARHASADFAVRDEQRGVALRSRQGVDEAKRERRIGWSSEEGTSAAYAGTTVVPEAKRSELSLAAKPPSVEPRAPAADPISAAELNDIAVESSQAERRAADAERELIEWKKMRFMADKVGDDFKAIILSVTKFGFFVELDEMFVEGLVPIGSLAGDFYAFRETDRAICGARTGHCFQVGQRVEVILDRIDRQARRLQFALLPGTEPQANTRAASVRSAKSERKKARGQEKLVQKKAGKPKRRKR